MRLKIERVGNSLGLVLPREVADKLKLEDGDTVMVTETATGFVIHKQDDESESQLAATRRAMKKFRAAFVALADR